MKQISLFLLLILTGWMPVSAQLDGTTLVHEWNRLVIDVIMEDGFGPPIAARIHTYANLAGYQAAFYAEPGYVSMVGKLNGFKECPVPDKNKVYDWRVSAVAAYQTACSKLLYRINFSDSLANVQFKKLQGVVDADVFERSKQFGIAVGKAINAYAKADGYPRTQGLPDWEWPRCDSCWEPTPPNFAKPLSPYCGRVRTIVLKNAEQFPVEPNVAFSTRKGSPFYKAAYEVYLTGKNLTPEQKEIANFWNDNPVVTNYRGHFVYNSRQISPGGHWMNIAQEVMLKEKTGMVKSMEVYTMLASALFDAFTACWAEKFKSNLIRPVTYINKYIDVGWEPSLQTPPFPEHASGHSTITAAAAVVLTHHFGDMPFVDSTEVPFGFPPRSFTSFKQASEEAGISRMYGGIHYRRACDAGAQHGTLIGNEVVAVMKMKEE